MDWLIWIGSWQAPAVFGVAGVLALLAAECFVVALRMYRAAKPVVDERPLLGAEFGVFSAQSAQLSGAPKIPRQFYWSASVGALAAIACAMLLRQLAG